MLFNVLMSALQEMKEPPHPSYQHVYRRMRLTYFVRPMPVFVFYTLLVL